jgi:NADH:ubiquinone oxidoreductase subunit K
MTHAIEPAISTEPAMTTSEVSVHRWLALAVAGSGLAGALHLWAAVNHTEDGARYVVFFLAAAVAQFALAGVLARRRHPVVVLAGALGTLALLSLYVASRVTTVATIAAHQHGAQIPRALEVAVVAAELAVTLALPTLVTDRWRAWAVNVAALCGVGLWTLWFFSSPN